MKEMEDYTTEMINALKRLSYDTVKSILDVMSECWRKGATVFVCGNGGSASTAEHFVNDLCKATLIDGLPRLRAVSLSSNISLITAWANDTSYSNIFAEQLRNLQRKGDILFVISASGNSDNIIEASRVAKEAGNTVIGLLGFDGGRAAELSDISLIVDSYDYGIVEGTHSFLCHLITNALKKRFSRENT